jgi:hypothetical protein
MRFLLWALITVTAFFSAGYWIGTHPGYYDKYLDLTKSEVLFYSQEENLFPPTFLNEIQNSSPMKMTFQTSSPQLADVLLVDSNFIKNSTFLKPKKSAAISWGMDQVSPDFQLDFFKENAAIPLLWKQSDTKLRILAIVFNHKLSPAQTRQLLEYFLSKDFSMQWMKSQDWNSTLLKIDESNVSEKRKAIFVRQLKLNKIEIQ